MRQWEPAGLELRATEHVGKSESIESWTNTLCLVFPGIGCQRKTRKRNATHIFQKEASQFTEHQLYQYILCAIVVLST